MTNISSSYPPVVRSGEVVVGPPLRKGDVGVPVEAVVGESHSLFVQHDVAVAAAAATATADAATSTASTAAAATKATPAQVAAGAVIPRAQSERPQSALLTFPTSPDVSILCILSMQEVFYYTRVNWVTF